MDNKILPAFIFSLFVVGSGSYAFAQSVEVNQIQILDPVVILETDLGQIAVELFPNDAPKHVENFIKLSQSGFYDDVVFHRIIPGFMIQTGDPNSIDGDLSTWGMGGPSTFLDAEFNTIKHNRGIVSMARTADPNSAGSQFFIVHADSNFLDQQYTVFGRIVTEESFQTLDNIAGVDTVPGDKPEDPEQVRITKVSVVAKSDVSDLLLDLPEPERTQASDTLPPTTGNQKFNSAKHGIELSMPEGWLLQEPDKTQANTPDVVAVGPQIGSANPVISLTIQETNERTLDDLISEQLELVKPSIDSGNLSIISQEKTTYDGYEAHVTDATGLFTSGGGEEFGIKFKEVLIYDEEKYYTFAYSHGLDDFDSQLPKFEETIDSFKILSDKTPEDEMTANPAVPPEGGDCLIATAAYGTKMAPQVQFLREIRDDTVMSTMSGTAFMGGFNTVYYTFAPTVADWERENPVFRDAVRALITPMISTLSIMTLADNGSEAEVLGLGISVIALNLGMYIAAPAVVIYKIKRQITS